MHKRAKKKTKTLNPQIFTTRIAKPIIKVRKYTQTYIDTHTHTHIHTCSYSFVNQLAGVNCRLCPFIVIIVMMSLFLWFLNIPGKKIPCRICRVVKTNELHTQKMLLLLDCCRGHLLSGKLSYSVGMCFCCDNTCMTVVLR